MLTDEQITIEVAKLDGLIQHPSQDFCFINRDGTDIIGEDLPDYLTSRDAIIPVIEKQDYPIQFSVVDKIQWDDSRQTFPMDSRLKCMFATPRQLCIALLKATGKYKE